MYVIVSVSYFVLIAAKYFSTQWFSWMHKVHYFVLVGLKTICVRTYIAIQAPVTQHLQQTLEFVWSISH